MTARTAASLIVLPSRWRAADAQALASRVDSILATVPAALLAKARESLVKHLCGENLPEHVRFQSGRYRWRAEVVGMDGRRQRVNRVLGRDWDGATQEQYRHYEAILATAKRTGDYRPLFAALESRKQAEQEENVARENERRHAATLSELWAAVGYKFKTRGGASYETVPTIWGGLTVGELAPQAIDDGIRKMETGDFTRPVRGGAVRKALPLSLSTIFRYLGAFRRALAVLRHADPNIPDIFAQRAAQLPPGKTIIDLIYPDRADATTITQRRKPSVYLDWENERLPFIARVLSSGLPYADDLAALLLTISLTAARPGSLARLTWEATPGGNYIQGNTIVLYQTKVTRRRRSAAAEVFEVNGQLRKILAAQYKRTGGKGCVFPELPANASDAIDRLADRWGLTRLRAYLFKHSALTDLALVTGGTPAQLAAEVHIQAQTLDKHYVLARGVTARHFRPGKPGDTILSRLWYSGLAIDSARGIIRVSAEIGGIK